MIIIRRPLAALIVAALFLPAARGAQAQDYPNRPIRLVVAFTAGGTTDFVARLLSERLRSLIGQPVIVDNRLGASGAIAAEHVAKSEPDGYTLFFTTVGAVAINPALNGNLPYDPVKDFAPVGMAVFNSTMLVVNAAMKINSGRELAALAKERPGHHYHRRHRARRYLPSRARTLPGGRRREVPGGALSRGIASSD